MKKDLSGNNSSVANTHTHTFIHKYTHTHTHTHTHTNYRQIYMMNNDAKFCSKILVNQIQQHV